MKCFLYFLAIDLYLIWISELYDGLFSMFFLQLLNSECTHAKRLKCKSASLLVTAAKLAFSLSTLLVVAVLVCFTSLQQEEKDKAVSTGIKPYSWNEFLNMVIY